MDTLRLWAYVYRKQLAIVAIAYVVMGFGWFYLQPFPEAGPSSFVIVSGCMLGLTAAMAKLMSRPLPHYVMAFIPLVTLILAIGGTALFVASDKSDANEARCLTDTVYARMPYFQNAMSDINRRKAEAMARINIKNARAAGRSLCNNELPTWAPKWVPKWELAFRIFRVIHLPQSTKTGKTKPGWEAMYPIMRNAVAGRYEFSWPDEFACADDFDVTQVRWIVNSVKRGVTRQASRQVGTIGTMSVRCKD